MPSLTNIAALLNKTKRPATTALWPVWKDSVRTEISFEPIPKSHALRIWYTARSQDRATHRKNCHGGSLGRAALAVLHSLIFDFQNWKSGRLDPSVKALASKAGVCERTAHTALGKLRSLKFLSWVRRCETHQTEDGRFALRQRTNAYQLRLPEHLDSRSSTDGPPPERDTLGYPARMATPLEAASQALRTGNRATMMRDLGSDPLDPLALALADLGALVERSYRTADRAK